MHHSYKSILVPVDLSPNTALSVKKGLELADSNSVVHLLHVAHPVKDGAVVHASGLQLQPSNSGEFRAIKAKLSAIEQAIKSHAKQIKVQSSIVVHTDVQLAIEEQAIAVGADLVVIGKSSSHSWFPFLNTVVPSRLVKKTGITVLTVKPGATNETMKNILVPVASEATRHKIEALHALSKKFKLKIYLATFTNNEQTPDDFNASALLHMYQWIKTTIKCPVEYVVLQGASKARAIMNYADKIDADVLLVHPVSETKIGWPNRHISDILPSDSKVQVLTVAPAEF